MKPIFDTISINDFVKRQTKDSGKTYTNNLSFEEIVIHAKKQLRKGKYRKGYRDGVLLVQVSKNLLHHFICPFTKIKESTILRAQVTKRRPNEQPYIQLRALNGTPLKTGSVELILYRHDVLAETNENTTECDWELISFHAIPKGINNMPMGPITMMRNQLELPGGTKAEYKSEEWANSIKFWQEYAVLKSI